MEMKMKTKKLVSEREKKVKLVLAFCGESCTGGGELTFSCDNPAPFRALNRLLQAVNLQCRSLNRDGYLPNYPHVYIEFRNYKR